MLAEGCRSSASANGTRIRCAIAAPTVDLPEPETPITTRGRMGSNLALRDLRGTARRSGGLVGGRVRRRLGRLARLLGRLLRDHGLRVRGWGLWGLRGRGRGLRRRLGRL